MGVFVQIKHATGFSITFYFLLKMGKMLLKTGIQQTMQKNSMGFIPWDEITVGKDRIPWEKDQQLVLFYAPTPKTHGNFTVFLLTL